MLRMLTLVALGGLAWWGYGLWTQDEAQAGAGGSGVGSGAPATEELEDAPLRVPGGGEARSDKVAKFIAALESGDARARARGFSLYEKAKSAEEKRRVGAALEGLIGQVESVSEAVELLGDRNAFLHSDLGRRSLADVVERLREIPPKQAMGLSTRLLEAGLEGDLSIEDTEARTAFDAAYDKHRNLVRRVVFDPGNAARARRYEVQSGDSLDRIARRFRKAGQRVSSGTLALVNRVDNPSALQIGQKLRIPIDPVRCVVHKASYALATYIGDDLVRVYWIAHGKEGHETPETTFVVGEAIANPDWDHEGRRIPFGHPDNPLGRFFVKFRHDSYSGFGAHGTNEPASIGTMASLGCLRLLPGDIEEFAKFVPAGTEVQVL